jgi:Uri superfamily endonuclease
MYSHKRIYSNEMSALSNFVDLPPAGGAYVLHLAVFFARPLVIEHLGRQHFPAGHYFYCGSARGAGGLRARVGRHVRGDGQPRWHIDYLRAVAEVREVFYTVTDIPLECAWSQALAQLPEAFIPTPGFGASDCRSGCGAHLIGFRSTSQFDRITAALAARTLTPIVSLRPAASPTR